MLARPRYQASVNEVNLIFTVTDKHGHYIPNLKQSDFALLDDQKAPEKVNSFHQQINLPLRVGILIDTSTSIHSRFQFEQQAAQEFLLQILKARSDRAFVMGFDVTPTVTADWTNDLDALETGINRLAPAAARRCSTPSTPPAATSFSTRRADRNRCARPLILLSDGDDNQSRVYLTKPSRCASALRPSSTPSAPTGRPAAARATRSCRSWPETLADWSSSRLPSKKFRPASRHRRGTAQPVCTDVHTCRLQDRRRISNDLSLLQRPAIPGARQERATSRRSK